MSQFFTSCGQSIGASGFNNSPSDEYSGLISCSVDCFDPFQFKGLSKVFNTAVQNHQFFGAQVSLWSNSHDHTWLLEKQKLNYGWIFVGKVMSLLFTMLSRLVIIFLPKSRRLLISWLKLLSVVILVPKQIKSVTVSIVSQYTCHEVTP